MNAGFGNSLMGDPIALTAVLALIGVFGWALWSLRRLARGEEQARRRASQLELRLNEAEAALAAEAHVLLIWRGAAEKPDRIIGNMHGLAGVLPPREKLVDFPDWLTPDSASVLARCLDGLRHEGTAFNIGVATRSGELLEADGRTAGGFATLRFRPLAGERRNIAALSHEALSLGREAERLRAVLDAAPLPVWLRQADGKLVWVNKSYAAAVDAPDGETAVARGVEIAGSTASDRAKSEGRIHAVLFTSPRSAQEAMRLLREAGLEKAAQNIMAIALSPRIAAALAALPWAEIRTASRPDHAALLACLGPADVLKMPA